MMPMFSEPEQFLLEQWTDARLLEDAMETVRSKYKGILYRIIEEVMKKHCDLDYSKKRINSWRSVVAIGKDTWPKEKNSWPSGFYIEEMRLENLTSPELESPYKFVWIAEPPIDSKDAEARLRKAAESILSKEEFLRLEYQSDNDGASLWCYLEESREELLKLLIKDEARGFIDCIIAHFEWMARFTLVVDDIVKNGKRSRK